MLAKERQDQIASKVNSDGSVLVKDLAEQYGVTEDSIRKDLSILEKGGLLQKTYGGAVKIRERGHDFYVAQRRNKNPAAKRSIAEKAYALIENGDTVFLDISTSNIELAKLLIEREKPVTVVSNMIEIMLTFAVTTPVRFVFIGGAFNLGEEGRDGFTGALANRQIENYRFDKSFMGVVGLDLDRNRIETYSAEDATTKETVIRNSNSSYLMLEKRKLNENGNCRYACPEDLTGAVLDCPVSKEEKEAMEARGLTVID